MRGWRTLTRVAVVVLAAAAPAAAQSAPAAPASPLVRADLYGTLGWFNAEADLPFNNWHNRSLHGGAGLGWYWTDHARTEVEFGATTKSQIYSSEPVIVGGHATFVGFRQSFSTRKLALGQYYQFYRNVWFHPHLAAGVDLSWERRQRDDDPVLVFDPGSRAGQISREPRQHPPTTSLEVRPFVGAGFKTYMSQRAFFRSDLRVGIRDGIDEVLLRFGFGVDF